MTPDKSFIFYSDTKRESHSSTKSFSLPVKDKSLGLSMMISLYLPEKYILTSDGSNYTSQALEKEKHRKTEW